MAFTLKKKTFKKIPKNQNFPKIVLGPFFFSKNQTFSQMYLWTHPARKDCFLIFQKEMIGF